MTFTSAAATAITMMPNMGRIYFRKYWHCLVLRLLSSFICCIELVFCVIVIVIVILG